MTDEAVYLPVALRIDGCRALVVGGGPVAERKVEQLLGHRAAVVVVSPRVTPRLREWAESGRVVLHDRKFQEEDLADCRLVFCATGDRQVNEQVWTLAERWGLPVNVVDVPELCSFIVPSILRREHLAVAVTTDGRCPAYSRWLRLRLEEWLDEAYGEALEIAAEVRQRLRERLRAGRAEEYHRLLETVLELDLPQQVRALGRSAAEQAAAAALRQSAAREDEPG